MREKQDWSLAEETLDVAAILDDAKMRILSKVVLALATENENKKFYDRALSLGATMWDSEPELRAEKRKFLQAQLGDCPICLDGLSIDSIVSMCSQSKHRMHERCLLKLLVTNSSCPICRDSKTPSVQDMTAFLDAKCRDTHARFFLYLKHFILNLRKLRI